MVYGDLVSTLNTKFSTEHVSLTRRLRQIHPKSFLILLKLYLGLFTLTEGTTMAEMQSKSFWVQSWRSCCRQTVGDSVESSDIPKN